MRQLNYKTLGIFKMLIPKRFIYNFMQTEIIMTKSKKANDKI